MIINYRAPIKGEHHDVSLTHDGTFSQYMVGHGFVIYPNDDKLFAPIDGVISYISPSWHAIVIKHETGINVLIHLGFGTVELKGEGINLLVTMNQIVKQGDLLLSFDYNFLKENTTSIDIPVVFMQKESIDIIKIDDQTPYIQLVLDVL